MEKSKRRKNLKNFFYIKKKNSTLVSQLWDAGDISN